MKFSKANKSKQKKKEKVKQTKKHGKYISLKRKSRHI